MISTLVFDVDGTLVDTNYHHAIAWFRAFRRFDITLPVWRLHRAIGMGGDQLVVNVAGDDVEKRLGDEVREAWGEEYEPFLYQVQPFAGARDVLAAVRERGVGLVLASSSPKAYVEHYLDLLDARELAQSWTTADDAENSKPAPDLVQTAMKKAADDNAVLIGDSVWDAEAARRAGITTYGVLTGGFSDGELTEAGVRKVYESLGALQDDLDQILTTG